MERKWQKRWRDARIFDADPDTEKPKFFITVAYPYPNSPQHIGHGRTYILCDVYARYMRMKGFNVLFPMAFHYTGTPVLAMSKRLEQGDEQLLNDFLNIYHVPKEEIENFYEPLNIARYFHQEIKMGMQELGFSIDWRREFTTIDPQYNRFIEWQFKKLRDLGLITKGSHPVGWCPSCASPMGQHDTSGDVEPEIGQFILIKFKLDGEILPTATLRSETVYGVTNIWVRPDIDYVRANIDHALWIISKECAEKLALQGRDVEIEGIVSGRELVGKHAINPVNDVKVPILPASFPDSNNATGIVMSVPAHAPVDLKALQDLKANPELFKIGLSRSIVEAIVPVPVIELEGSSEIPAQDILAEYEVENQLDPKLEKASALLYSREYHRGVMKDNASKYVGMNVGEARESIEKVLMNEGKADSMYELINRPIFCRCGSELTVKIFEDQWFINYKDPEWKAITHRCLDKMRIVPEEMRAEFNYVIDWLNEKACARKYGLGTKLPWDPDWIIESLSDSVIYMAYYTVSRHIKEYGIRDDSLIEEVFDYIFYGKGELEDVAIRSKINLETLRHMRNQFLYFYPLDSRNSASDLVPNHLTFFIFNHVALFPEELWPRQIAVNNLVLMEGKKMSKSTGNIIPIREAIDTFGADPLRLSIQATAELLQQADFNRSLAKSVRERLDRFYDSVKDLSPVTGSPIINDLKHIDKWLLSRLHNYIRITTDSMEILRVRDAIHNVLYRLGQDVQWYLRRVSVDENDPTIRTAYLRVLREVLEKQILMLTPFTPHLCEEMWENLCNKAFISLEKWPQYNEMMIDNRVEELEKHIIELHSDTQNIINATGIESNRIIYYTASDWKWNVYLAVLEHASKGRFVSDNLIREVMKDTLIRREGDKAVKMIRTIWEIVRKMPDDMIKLRLQTGKLDERKLITNAIKFYRKEFNATIEVYNEDDLDRYDPIGRSKTAIPYRPAIYLE